MKKSEKKVMALSKKYQELKKQKNVSDIELKNVYNEFNKAVSEWCKLEDYYKTNPVKKREVKILINNEIKTAVLKKTFEVFNHKFAVVDYPVEIYNGSNSFYNSRLLIHLPTGGGIPLFSNKKGTLKSFVLSGLENINLLYKREGHEKFNSVLNSYAVIN